MSEIQRLSDEGGELPPSEPGQHPDIATSFNLARAAPLACRPGEAMQYCNRNFNLLGDLVRRVSGTSIERFAQERIFGPLGMTDSSYVLPPEHGERKVRRGEGMPGYPDLDSEGFETCPWGGGGVHSTARDMAVFAQMLLEGGAYDGRRVLSSASVQAMRRNHVAKGIPARWDMVGPGGRIVTIETPGAYGYGLFPYLDSIMAYYNGGLSSRTSFGHVGFGGTGFWADPELDLVGVYFSIARRNLLGNIPDWRADLFADAVAGAVED
jgi:CubicO group peptidase (beta-lactamase class C family)